MSDAPRKAVTPEQLSTVLARLDEVMAEASRLRREVTRQMADQQRRQQQKIVEPRRAARKRSS